MNYVIIGNSAAAVGCIEGIRSVDPKGKITVISREPYHTYSRPLISYLLCGKTDEERMKYRGDDFYEKNQVSALLGTAVNKIEPDKKCVVLESGQEVPYDKLLIATGSRPFIPPMEGLDGVDRKYTFMSLDDAKALEGALTPESRVLVIGAGLIGLKCVEGISGKVKEITVVDLADRILPSILDEAGSRIMQDHIEGHGVRFYLSDSVSAFSGNTAKLKSGVEIGFDILVVAVGVRPNVELAAEAGAEVNKGILTDDRCAATLNHVFAAGDCTESRDITTGGHRVLALLPNAYMQGETAGVNMAGGEKRYQKAIPMNAIGFFGLHIITAGSYDGDAYVTQGEGTYKKLVTRNGVMKGYILIGDVARAGIYTSLIREQTALDTIDFDLIKERPQLMAFTARDRAVKLGGAKA